MVHLLTPVAENPRRFLYAALCSPARWDMPPPFAGETVLHQAVGLLSEEVEYPRQSLPVEFQPFWPYVPAGDGFYPSVDPADCGALSDIWLIIASSILFVLFLADTITTVRTMLLMNKKLEKIHETLDEMRGEAQRPWMGAKPAGAGKN